MAGSISSRYKIKAGAPDDWTHDDSINLEMYYLVSGITYVFLYIPVSADRLDKSFNDDFVQNEGVEFLRGEIVTDPATGISKLKKLNLPYIEQLDIGIRHQGGNVLVTVKIVDNGAFKDMYWFQNLNSNPQIEAIMTENDRKYYYGDLEYSDNGASWSKTASQTCQYIRFKAKKKKRNPPATHKFSYNVLIPDPQGNPVHLEIDPDIQNPKV